MKWPRGFIRQNEPLAKHTSFRIGGPAEWFAEPESVEELEDLLRESRRAGLPVLVLGGGTNVLASDRGISGIVVHLGRGFRSLVELSRPDEPTLRIRCGAGLLTQRLVTLAARRGWAELERLAGMPGQIGGAVAMNAQGIGRFVEQVRLISTEGSLRTINRDQLRFSYRCSAMESGIIIDLVLRFSKVSAEKASSRIRRALEYRNRTQETQLPSAGCAFMNPPGQCAGRLIEEVGLKGARIGDAQVSQRHANFIVNLSHATCSEVLALMEHIQRSVNREFGVFLQPELRVLGESIASLSLAHR